MTLLGRNGECGENRQQEKQIRGFFPFDFAQGQNDNLLWSVERVVWWVESGGADVTIVGWGIYLRDCGGIALLPVFLHCERAQIPYDDED